MADDNYLDWIDTSKTFETGVDYHDPSSTPPLVIKPSSNLMTKAQESAKQLETKMYGKDVRASLAQWILLGGYLYNQGILTLQQYASALDAFKNDMIQRQGDVEHRQTDVEEAFKQVIANATTDSELINARDSTIYGQFGVLDERMENIEQMLAMLAPAGYTVNIDHELGRNPIVTVVYYEYAIGTEPNGLGTGPAGTFGGTPAKTLSAAVSYPDANNVKIDLPIGFKLSGVPVYQPADHRYYIIDGYRTLRFDLGITDTDSPNEGEQPSEL